MKLKLCRYLIFPLLLMLLFSPATGKGISDSLSNLLGHSSGIVKLRVLLKLSDVYMDNHLDSSFYYLQLLKKNALKMHRPDYVSDAYTSLGLYYFYKGKYFDAETHLLKAIKLQESAHDSVRLAHAYNVLAGIYGVNGAYKKSIQILYKALKIYEARHNMEGMETVYNNWGYLYMKLNRYHKAEYYFKRALATINENHLNKNKGFLYNNIGICYKQFESFDSAYYFFHKALKEYSSHKTNNAIPMVYQSLGNLYAFHWDKPDSARMIFEKGIRLARRDDPNSLVELYYSLGELEAKEQNYEQGLTALKKSLELAIKNKDLNGQKNAQYELYRIFKKTNRIPQSFSHFQQYVTLKDSIDNKAVRLSFARLEAKYKNEKNLIYIKQLKEKQRVNQHIRIVMVIGMITLVILVLLLIYGISQRKKRNAMEKELLRVEKEKMDKELRYQNRQLASQSLIMMQKNKMLQLLYRSLKEAPKNPEEFPKYLSRLKQQIKRTIQSEKDWEIFKLYFEQVNKTFFKKLKALNPELTQNDLRLAALIKLGFNIKESAAVLNLSPNSIKGSRYRLRTKLGLKKEEDLFQFIGNID